MGFNYPFVFPQEPSQRHRFRWRKCKVVKYPAVGNGFAIFFSRGLQFRRQLFARGRVLVLTEPEKFISADFAGQSQPFRTGAKPFAGHTLAFVVVIADTEMFLEVFLGIFEIVLRLRRNHAWDTIRTVRAFCVSDTSSLARFLVNCRHENEPHSDAEARQPALAHLLHRP
jgi:hypothetical protein